MRVTLVDAQKANDLFRTLMGEEVEERRNFIFEKGINVKDAIDYGAWDRKSSGRDELDQRDQKTDGGPVPVFGIL